MRVAVTALALASFAGCEKPAPAANGDTAPTTGALWGKVKLVGDWPAFAGDPPGRPQPPDLPPTWPWRTPFEDGGLPWVVVHAVDGPRANPAPATDRPVTVEVNGHVFRPPISLARPGDRVRVMTHDDDTVEVAHAGGSISGTSALRKGADVEFTLPRESMEPVRLSAKDRPWMDSRVLVFDHACVAVTTVDGSFAFEGLAPGRYRFRVERPADTAGPVEPAEFEADVRAGEMTWKVVEVRAAAR